MKKIVCLLLFGIAGCGGIHIDADIHPKLIPKKPDEQNPAPQPKPKPRPWQKQKQSQD